MVPPFFLLLQQSHREIMGLSGEIKRLSVTLNESEQRCTDLDTINSSLLQKLKSVDENLEIACKTNRVTAHCCTNFILNGLIQKLTFSPNR